jgi:hypothetical protein
MRAQGVKEPSLRLQAMIQHPRARHALSLGLFALLVPILGPFAWSTGRSVVRDIDASPGTYSGHLAANAGRILGIVATFVLLSFLGIAVFGGVSATGPNP